MKKGFTLVEMLIVVVVLVTLMSIMFKLSSIGEDQSARTATINRLQRLENCVSGYYAAYGSYPPVALHGSRDYGYPADMHGIQKLDEDPNEDIWDWDVETFKKWVDSDFSSKYEQRAEEDAWAKVEAACRSQPLGCDFPFADNMNAYVRAKSLRYQELLKAGRLKLSEKKRKMIEQGFTSATEVRGQFGDETEWSEIQLYRFGLMSYLLPRYLMMMVSDEEFLERPQWTDNNKLPCDPYTGRRYTSWRDVRREIYQTSNGKAKIGCISSQSACARWLPNLQDACSCTGKKYVFGVLITNRDEGESMTAGGIAENIYSPHGFDSTTDQYVLDRITMLDGWGQEFYYYSPVPNQTYVLWSSGRNRRTFPPWVDRARLEGKAKPCVAAWTADDIIHMSN